MVGSGAPFQSTTEVAMKPLPLIVRVNVPLPAAALAGDSDDRAGAGLAVVMVKVAEFEVPLAPETVMPAVPAATRSEAGTCAVSRVELA